MTPVQFLREGLGDPSFAVLGEWENERGTIGAYRSEAYGYSYVQVLLDGENRVYFLRQYVPHTPLEVVLKDAEILATFAGATKIG